MMRNWHIDITSSICGCTGIRIAVAAHSVLGLRDLSRTDLTIYDTGPVYFL